MRRALLTVIDHLVVIAFFAGLLAEEAWHWMTEHPEPVLYAAAFAAGVLGSAIYPMGVAP